MKQYRRTRTEASKDGVKAAKVLVKSRAIRHIHPLIKGCDPKSCTDFIVEKADFIRQLQTFRPSQTVFETGIGTSVNRATKGVKDSVGAHAMKALRKEVESALERNKVKASIYDSVLKGGEESEEIIGFDDEEPAFLFDEYAEGEEDLEVTREEGDHDEDSPLHRRDDEGSVVESIADKVRLSRAARKKMKKLHLPIFTRRPAAPSDSGVELTMSEPVLREGGSFQDPRFYMTYGTEDEKAVFSEASMQPKSNLRDRETQGANMLEYALLDVAPDAAADLNAKRRIMRWDAKKRKFVKQSLEEMAQSGKGSKRIRTESGTVVRGSSAPAGELYAKWKKKTRREISVSGEDEGPRPRAAVNNGVRSELRGADEIRRMKRSKDDVKLKNMRRDKRSQIEGKLRKQKKATRENTILANRPGNRKMKIILRT
jgi:ATP-dependent RNA helicase DDX54/DBP10